MDITSPEVREAFTLVRNGKATVVAEIIRERDHLRRTLKALMALEEVKAIPFNEELADAEEVLRNRFIERR